jgi:hypothetical protein
MRVNDILEEVDFDLDDEESDDGTLVVGVIGSRETDVNDDVLFELIDDMFDEIVDEFIIDGDFEQIAIASKAIDSGVHKIAFKIAEERGFTTIGLVDGEEEIPSYPTDEIVVATNDEDDDFFIDYIDVLIRVGSDGDTSATTEMAEAEDIPIFEEDI